MRKMICLLLALCALCAFALPVLAESVAMELPVQVTLGGYLPYKAETNVIVLKADDPSFPMPSGSINGEFNLAITGAATSKFPPVAFTERGVYTYTVRELAGINSRCHYDQTVYHVTAYCVNGTEGKLDLTVVLEREGAEEKPEILLFNNYYDPIPDTPKTDDETNVPLYAGLAAVSAVVLVGLFVTRKRKPEF